MSATPGDGKRPSLQAQFDNQFESMNVQDVLSNTQLSAMARMMSGTMGFDPQQCETEMRSAMHRYQSNKRGSETHTQKKKKQAKKESVSVSNQSLGWMELEQIGELNCNSQSASNIIPSRADTFTVKSMLDTLLGSSHVYYVQPNPHLLMQLPRHRGLHENTVVKGSIVVDPKDPQGASLFPQPFNVPIHSQPYCDIPALPSQLPSYSDVLGRLDPISYHSRDHQVGQARQYKYYTTLDQYFRCQLSKLELEQVVLELLGPIYTQVHNQQLKCILYNSQSVMEPLPQQPVQIQKVQALQQQVLAQAYQEIYDTSYTTLAGGKGFDRMTQTGTQPFLDVRMMNLPAPTSGDGIPLPLSIGEEAVGGMYPDYEALSIGLSPVPLSTMKSIPTYGNIQSTKKRHILSTKVREGKKKQMHILQKQLTCLGEIGYMTHNYTMDLYVLPLCLDIYTSILDSQHALLVDRIPEECIYQYVMQKLSVILTTREFPSELEFIHSVHAKRVMLLCKQINSLACKRQICIFHVSCCNNNNNNNNSNNNNNNNTDQHNPKQNHQGKFIIDAESMLQWTPENEHLVCVDICGVRFVLSSDSYLAEHPIDMSSVTSCSKDQESKLLGLSCMSMSFFLQCLNQGEIALLIHGKRLSAESYIEPDVMLKKDIVKVLAIDDKVPMDPNETKSKGLDWESLGNFVASCKAEYGAKELKIAPLEPPVLKNNMNAAKSTSNTASMKQEKKPQQPQQLQPPPQQQSLPMKQQSLSMKLENTSHMVGNQQQQHVYQQQQQQQQQQQVGPTSTTSTNNHNNPSQSLACDHNGNLYLCSRNPDNTVAVTMLLTIAGQNNQVYCYNMLTTPTEGPKYHFVMTLARDVLPANQNLQHPNVLNSTNTNNIQPQSS